MKKNTYVTWLSLLLTSTTLSPSYAMDSPQETQNAFSRSRKFSTSSKPLDPIEANSQEDKEDKKEDSSSSNFSNASADTDDDSGSSDSIDLSEFSDNSSNSNKTSSTDYSYALRFNEIINELCKINKDLSSGNSSNSSPSVPAQQHQLWEELHSLGESFVHNAMKFGRIIIEEYYSNSKIINPASLGGIAGGGKYIAHGILFKFPEDKKLEDDTWLYGGHEPNPYLAAKSAGQELLSANYVGSADISLKVPLMAIVDYWGYRLMATSLLPLSQDSHVYGSADAGLTFADSSPSLCDLMDKTGEKLNLRKHKVGSISTALCGDIEVHKLKFERESGEEYYCLDAARVFPPEAPQKVSSSIFYEKLRPEFVKRYSIPLSSDAFTGFQTEDELSSQYNTEIFEATK